MKITCEKDSQDIQALEKSTLSDKIVLYTVREKRTGKREKRNELDHGAGKKNPCGGRG